jgi:hypothetical protein
VAEHGWENDDVFVMAFDFGDAIPLGDPEILVDKLTGAVFEIAGLLGADPAPNLRPIRDVPD